jgi:autoinducer 2-degrading protein
MIATCVNIWVKKDEIEEFIKESLENHRESIKEEGNLRFDVLQNSEDPTRFTLYEAYETVEAVAKHKESAHYKKWRANVEPMMAKAREGIKHNILAPMDIGAWK